MKTVSIDADSIITAVNYHFYKPCNMKCGFCFATFNDIPNKDLSNSNSLLKNSYLIIDKLAEFGFKKINFAGGEPLLYKKLPELIRHAKKAGLSTSIITNGSLIDAAFMDNTAEYLDWVGVSIDSINAETNKNIGRFVKNNQPCSAKDYALILGLINSYNINLKVNTVVNAFNYKEQMNDLFEEVMPKRWKIFQALPVEGQNDRHISDFIVSKEQYDYYLLNNSRYEEIQIKEDNELMTGSYIMIDPTGRFFDDTKGHYTYSKSIVNTDIETALREVSFDKEKFNLRGGNYKWSK